MVLSQKSDQRIISAGDALSDSECCLPVKAFAGHLADLVGRCDYIFAPRFERTGKQEEFCVRFWGLTDLARGTLPGVRILSSNLQSGRYGAQLRGFLGLGRTLGKSKTHTLRAYWRAVKAQRVKDARGRERQLRLLSLPGLKVLVAAQPYISYDAAIGSPLVKLLREQGITPVFAESCPRPAARQAASKLTHSLYWTMNKEIVGAIELLRPQIDGVILVSAFPCGTDCLVNELLLRRVKDLPITQIILDGLHGQAGLQTRIECFADILRERRRGHAG